MKINISIRNCQLARENKLAIANRQISKKYTLIIVNCKLQNANCKFLIVYCLLPIALCLLPIANCFSQVFTLDSILNRIEKNNPMLKMYDEQINAIGNYSQMAKSWMPPTISTGPWQVPYMNIVDGMWMITGEQMIPNPAKQKANYNFMQGMSTVEAEEKTAKRNEMFAKAKQNYYEWIVLKKKLDVLVQTDSLLNYIVQVAQLRYTYNKEKLSNIYKAQADLFELRNMETMFLADMKMKNVELNTLMNADKDFEFDIDTTIISHNYELQIPDTSLISSARSDIKQFDASIGLIKLQQQLEKSKRLPDFGISLSHMQSLGEMPNQFSAMGMITIPIVPWASKGYKSNLNGLNNTSNAINYQKQALLNETAGMIVSLQIQILSSKKQLTNYQSNICPTYYKSYQSSILAYEQNTEDLFVVLDGLKMYRTSKMNELDQLNTLLNLQLNYEKEMEIR